MDPGDEKHQARPTVPRLHLGAVGAETARLNSEIDAMLALTTGRSEVSELLLPTSLRSARMRTDRGDKIPVQIERLTGLIENMMDTLQDADCCSQETTLKLPAVSSDSTYERLLMRLEDAAAENGRLREEKRKVKEELALLIGVESVESDLRGEWSLEVAKRIEELLVLAQSLDVQLDTILSDSLSRKLSIALKQLKEKEAAETIFATELRSLKRHIENLSGERLNSLSGNWEWEVPAFCRNVIQTFSSRSNTSPPVASTPQSFRLTCSALELNQAIARLCEVLEDWEQTGAAKEFGVQLGALSVSVLVHESEGRDAQALLDTDVAAVARAIACRREGAMTERGKAEEPREEIDKVEYIHQLEEKIIDLQSQLSLQGNAAVPESAFSSDLECKLEELTYKLSLANRQIEKLKHGQYNPDEERLAQNYKRKLAETVLREERLKEEMGKIALEREKFRLDLIQFESEKSAFFQDHEAAVLELEQAFADLRKDCSDAEVQVDADPRIQELETTCKILQEENHRSQLMLASQQVMKKEDGQWATLGVSKKIAKEVQALYEEIEKGIEDPSRLLAICRRLLKVTTRLESGCEDGKTDTATGDSLFSLSNEEIGSDWSGHSPGFSVSRIDQHRDELTADLKLKEDQMETLREELRETEEKLGKVMMECERLREERKEMRRKEEEMEALRKRIEEFMSFRTTELQQIESQKRDLTAQFSSFEAEKSAYREKRSQLREKINQINDRQKKLQSKEKLLTEKETLLLLQEKKADLHKQGVDQLWRENDEKRLELLKCQRVIDDEWKVLMEETRQFEALKIAEKRVRSQVELDRAELETQRVAFKRQSDDLQQFAAKLTKDREAIDREKAKVRSERSVLESERSLIQRTKQSLLDRLQRSQNPEVPNSHKSEESSRELAALLPALQSLLEESIEES